MSLSLAIAIIVIADVALIGGLAYVMSRAKLLNPHVSRNATAATPRHAHARPSRPVRRPARVRTSAIGVEA